MEKTRLFSENNRQGCQNCSPRVQGDLLKNFFGKNSFFISSLGIELAFLSFRRNFCQSGRQYCFLFVNCTSLCWNSLCQKIFSPNNFGYWLQIYRCLFKFFSTKLTTLFSTSPKDQFGDKQLFWQNFLSLFSSFVNIERIKKVFFAGKPISRFVKPAYDFSRRSFEELFVRKGSFFALHWHLSKFFSGIPAKNSVRCRQNCFVSVHCNNLW